jgi:hypothetical protein
MPRVLHNPKLLIEPAEADLILTNILKKINDDEQLKGLEKEQRDFIIMKLANRLLVYLNDLGLTVK